MPKWPKISLRSNHFSTVPLWDINNKHQTTMIDSERSWSATSPPRPPRPTTDLSREETVMTSASRMAAVRLPSLRSQASNNTESNRLGEVRPSKQCINRIMTKTTLDKTIYTPVGTEDKEEDPTASRPADCSTRIADMRRRTSKRWIALTRSHSLTRTAKTSALISQVTVRAIPREASRAPRSWLRRTTLMPAAQTPPPSNRLIRHAVKRYTCQPSSSWTFLKTKTWTRRVNHLAQTSLLVPSLRNLPRNLLRRLSNNPLNYPTKNVLTALLPPLPLTLRTLRWKPLPRP